MSDSPLHAIPGHLVEAAGWKVIGQRPPRKGWSVPSRPRDNDRYVSAPRQLWEVLS